MLDDLLVRKLFVLLSSVLMVLLVFVWIDGLKSVN